MITISECKKILNEKWNLSDKQIFQIRVFLYQLAEIEKTELKRKKDAKKCSHIH